jgi:hypothetical protein
MELAKIVTLGYFMKAFGENVARIIFSAIFGEKSTDETQTGNEINETPKHRERGALG